MKMTKAIKLPAPTEAQEAKVLMQYMKLRNLKFSHIKNETGKSASGSKVRNWRAVYGYLDGVSPGFPDFIVLVPGQLLAIELKRTKGSVTSQQQKEWIQALLEAGVPARVCRGADEAIGFIQEYLPLAKSVGSNGVF